MRHVTRWSGGGVAAVVVALVVSVAPSASAAEPDQTFAVEATVVNLVAESEDELGGVLVVQTVVEVDGQLVDLPADLPVTAATGDAVTLTVQADAGMTVDAALETATEGGTSAEGEAQIVAVTVEPAPAGQSEDVLLAAATGTHTLTVLPVYWNYRDSATQTSLTNLAATTAQYWAEQSSGRLSIQPDVRDWQAIADPGSCNTSQLLSSALAANGMSGLAANQHVLVYFPNRADCGGWAGLASIGSGYIWVNGYQLPDVMAHEFGHNLGLGHANRATCSAGGGQVPLALPFAATCSAAEYADRADVMGMALGAASGNLNTALADSLGWATVSRASSTVPAVVDLAPLAQTGSLRSVSVQISSDTTVYVDYRPPVGRDTRMPAWAGVQVHVRISDAAFGYPRSYLLDMGSLVGQPSASPAFPTAVSWQVPGTAVVLTVLGTGATARLQISGAQSGNPAPTWKAAGDRPAISRSGAFYLLGATGVASDSFTYGDPTDVAVMGDWDGNGTRTPGVFRAGTWYLRNSNSSGGADVSLRYGSPGDLPVVGDWDGNGTDTPGVFRGGRWYLRNSTTSGVADLTVGFGSPGDLPVVGDWDGDGTDTPGVFRGGRWYVTNRFDRGSADGEFGFGSPGDLPVSGDWDGDGDDSFAVYRGGMWYLTDEMTQGYAEIQVGFGDPGDKPLPFR